MGWAFTFTDLAFSRSEFVKVMVFLRVLAVSGCERGCDMGVRCFSERVNAHIPWRSRRDPHQASHPSSRCLPAGGQVPPSGGLCRRDYFVLFFGSVALSISGLTFCSMPRRDGLRTTSFAGMRLMLKRSANSAPNFRAMRS